MDDIQPPARADDQDHVRPPGRMAVSDTVQPWRPLEFGQALAAERATQGDRSSAPPTVQERRRLSNVMKRRLIIAVSALVSASCGAFVLEPLLDRLIRAIW